MSTLGKHWKIKDTSNMCQPKTKKHRKHIAEAQIGKHFKIKDTSNMKGRTGEKNGRWKGDNAGKVPMHKWVERMKGKANKYMCVDCNNQARDWSNIDHSYKRRLEDYFARCRSCHQIYDNKFNLQKL